MSTPPPTVVLVDPTSPDGETALDLVRDDEQHVIVVVLMSGRCSAALREFAHHENVGLSTAAWIYLDQVAQRLARPGRIVGTIAATGPDTAFELAVVATEHDVERVLFPTSVVRIDGRAPRRLAAMAPVTVEAPAAPATT